MKLKASQVCALFALFVTPAILMSCDSGGGSPGMEDPSEEPTEVGVTGTVTSGTDGEAVEGASIEILRPDNENTLASATTDSSGSYEASFTIDESDRPNQLRLTFSAEGFVDEEVTADFKPSISKDVALEVATTEATASGTITDGNTGNPIEGATVTGTQPDSSEQLFEATTASDGGYVTTFQVADEPSEVTIQANADSFESSETIVSFSEQISADLVLQPATTKVTASGAVSRSDTGDPIEAAIVVGTLGDGSVVFEATTDAEGIYETTFETSSDPDEVTIEAEADGFEAETKTVSFTEDLTNDFSLSPDIEVLRVDKTASGTGDGMSWDNAITSLQDALDKASGLETVDVWVASGTYKPDEGENVSKGDRAASYFIPDGTKVFGGFEGNETERVQRDADPETNDTVLDGDLDQQDFPGDNSYHVVRIPESGSVTLDGFTVQNGFVDESTSDDCGSAIFSPDDSRGRYTIKNTLIKNNKSVDNTSSFCVYGTSNSSLSLINLKTVENDGGIEVAFIKNLDIENSNSISNGSDGIELRNIENLSINNVITSSNKKLGIRVLRSEGKVHGLTSKENSGGGGGIFNSTIGINSSVFKNNTGGIESYSGGLWVEDSKLNIDNCLFEGNKTNKDIGGGISFSAGLNSDGIDVSFTNSTVIGNTVERADYGGGIGITSEGYYSIKNVLIKDNLSKNGGGIAVLNHESGSIEIKNSNILNNEARNEGGGLFISETPKGLSLSNILINGNSAQSGGGVSLLNSDPKFTNITTSSNKSTNKGPSAFIHENSLPKISNSIFWGVGKGTQQIAVDKSDPLIRYSLVEGGMPEGAVGGDGVFGESPLFANQLGPDGEAGTEDDNLRLTPESPGIDAGANSLIPEGLTKDFAGEPRVQDNDGDGDEIVNLGAFEIVETQ